MGDPVTEKIISSAIEVHRILGLGLLESIYEEAFGHEFTPRAIQFARQIEGEVIYKNQKIKGQRLDLLANGEVIVEIKAVCKLDQAFNAQVLSYLKGTGLKRALLINFGQSRLIEGVKRIFL